jgi:hypothetical protein
MEPGFLARGLRILKGRVPSYSADGEELPEEVLYTVDAGWLDRRFILKKNHIHTVGVLAQGEDGQYQFTSCLTTEPNVVVLGSAMALMWLLCGAEAPAEDKVDAVNADCMIEGIGQKEYKTSKTSSRMMFG